MSEQDKNIRDMVKVRFNLGRGDRYMKWQIKDGKSVKHFDPKDVTLVMHGAKLVNHPTTAQKIFDGANKTVCAWVECESIEIFDKGSSMRVIENLQVSYNPRVAPNWKFKGQNVDKATFSTIISRGNKLYSQTHYHQ